MSSRVCVSKRTIQWTISLIGVLVIAFAFWVYRLVAYGYLVYVTSSRDSSVTITSGSCFFSSSDSDYYTYKCYTFDAMPTVSSNRLGVIKHRTFRARPADTYIMFE